MNIWNCMNAKQGDAKPGRARSAKKQPEKNGEENGTPARLIWSLGQPLSRKLRAFSQAQEGAALFYSRPRARDGWAW